MFTGQLQEFHPFGLGEDTAGKYRENEMSERQAPQSHEHVAKRVHVLRQRAGVPYEVEQQVCADCARILAEKPVKRAAA